MSTQPTRPEVPPPLVSGMGVMVERLRSHRGTLRALRTTLLAGTAAQVTLAITGVIAARALGPKDRGYLALLTLIYVIAIQVAALGLPFALTFSVARVPGRTLEILRGVRMALRMRLAAAPLMAAAMLAALMINKPGYVVAGALAAVIVTIPGILQQCGLGILEGLQKFVPLGVLGVAPNAAFALISATLLLVGQGGFIQLTAAWGVGIAIFGPVTFRKARSEAEHVQDPDAPVSPAPSWILRFGRRSMLGATPPIETYRFDQAVVALFLAPVSLGLYVVALAFTNLPRFVALAIGIVASPLISSCNTQALARRRMWQFFLLAIPLYASVGAALWIAAPQLTNLFFGSRFAEAAPLTRLLLVATMLYCARRVLSDAARGAGYPLAGTVAEIVAFCAAIPSFGLFVPTSGTHGVAYALIASSTMALAVLVGALLHPGARSSMSEWFQTISDEDLDDMASPADQGGGESRSIATGGLSRPTQ
jgi:O-antigen/teichoic acid export membrane protein